MKKILLSIIALLGVITADAQMISVYENGNLVRRYQNLESKKYDLVFQESHDYVDLGLPSGTLWATCNVGATKPEEYGDYFAWGETTGYLSGKTNFDYSTYKHCDGSYKTITKYCTNSYWGTVDNKIVLESSDDAATVNWGSEWCMPTMDQLRELYNSSYTNTEFTTLNGVYGCKITSRSNGHYLFLPANGFMSEECVGAGTSGYYASNSLGSDNGSIVTYNLFFKSELEINDTERCSGKSVRPVRKM